MKKFYLLFLGILSFIGINTVSADTFSPSDFYNNFDILVNDYYTYKENIDYLINYWDENFSSEFPYYGVIEYPTGTIVGEEKPVFVLYYTNNNKVSFTSSDSLQLDISYTNDYYNAISYNSNTNSYVYSDIRTLPYIYGGGTIKGLKLLISNNLYYDKGVTDFDKLLFPSYTSDSLDFTINEFELSNGDVFPTIISLYDKSYDLGLNDYIEVNLNNYAYVALSLKDYEDIPLNNSSRYTNFYVKGQLCVTPVYNYGLTERKDVLTNSKMQGCSQYYDDFTLTRMYILKTDVENHAIYYFKAYDTSKDNILKVDTSIFNITYISEENKNNPEVLINNKYYPTLPYDSLTDTATKSESEGYVSGITCAVGDFNCYSENNSENLFDEIFSSPLDFLKSIWDTVTSIFSLIAEFISLLPVPMQSFLYLSFMIAIILGLLKILL